MKFSIRDLLLVTVIAALAVGWWLDHGKLAAEIGRLKELELRWIRDRLDLSKWLGQYERDMSVFGARDADVGGHKLSPDILRSIPQKKPIGAIAPADDLSQSQLPDEVHFLAFGR